MHIEDPQRVPVENFRYRKAVSRVFLRVRACWLNLKACRLKHAISESHVLHKILSGQRVSDIKFSKKERLRLLVYLIFRVLREDDVLLTFLDKTWRRQ